MRKRTSETPWYIPADSGSSSCADGPCTSSNDLLACLALPDTNALALDSVLTTECAGVPAMLGDFDLLDLTTERRTVTGTVFT